MKKCIVTLFSEQLVPSYLFIRTFDNDYQHIFISTHKMENNKSGAKSKILQKSLGLTDERISNVIIVDENNYSEIVNQLNEVDFAEYADVYVNLTGGTKIMSMALFDFFKDKTKNCWYLPIGKNEIHNVVDSSLKKDIVYRLNVKEYLACCGIFEEEGYKILPSNYSVKQANAFYDWLFENLEDNKVKIDAIRKLFRSSDAKFKKIYEKNKIVLKDYNELNSIYDLIDVLNLSIENEIISKNDIDFITGGWFEYYCYYKVASEKIDDIKINVSIKANIQGVNSNEYDILYTHDNKLNVMECKTFVDKILFSEAVYKLSALRKYFGLAVKSEFRVLDLSNHEHQIIFAKNLDISIHLEGKQNNHVA